MQDKEEEEKASELVGKPQKTDAKDLDDIVNLNLSALYGALYVTPFLVFTQASWTREKYGTSKHNNYH